MGDGSLLFPATRFPLFPLLLLLHICLTIVYKVIVGEEEGRGEIEGERIQIMTVEGRGEERRVFGATWLVPSFVFKRYM